MAAHNDLGRTAEDHAAEWLKQQGYEVIQRNWRHAQYEIDIIAKKGNKLHFVEVKCRRSSRYGYPEDSVTRRKFKYLQRAADEYLHRNPGHLWIQYDILSIILKDHEKPEFFLLEDVYL